MDANQTYEEKAWRQLHKNAVSCIEQVLEATPHKKQLYDHLSPIRKAIQVRRTRQAGHCWRDKDELISDVLLWTPSHRWAKVGRPGKTYIRQLYADTGCSLEDLPGAIDDRDGCRERVREFRASSATWWWWQTFLKGDILDKYPQGFFFLSRQCSLLLLVSNINYEQCKKIDLFLLLLLWSL